MVYTPIKDKVPTITERTKFRTGNAFYRETVTFLSAEGDVSKTICTALSYGDYPCWTSDGRQIIASLVECSEGDCRRCVLVTPVAGEC
ncbi:hypothetical protein [Methanomassiliicoccus luminyensis]|uniref:hypothetical protein n=1 Tax=Methanomassiliicoccus luminyensis TaxID=1080712 RepID=UPI0011C89B79|nr:hypothetical protein [Methanomassiliicoccus luminyensis]